MLDLHVHDAHFIRLLFGMPAAVSTCGRVRSGLAEHWTTQFLFSDSNLAVTATSGVINQQGRAFDHGFEIHLERATLVFEFAVLGDDARYLCEPMLLDESGKAIKAELTTGDPMMEAFEAEIAQVVQTVSGGETSNILTADLARDAIELCHAQNASLIEGKRVEMKA
jgi:predicted dehydrogenase